MAFFYGNGPTAQDKQDSRKGLYAGILAALSTGKPVEVYGNNQGCVVEATHFIDQ